MESLDSGELILFDEQDPKPFSSKFRVLLSKKIGYLFQNFALVQKKSVEKNMMIALDGQKVNKKKVIKNALEEVGLKDFERKKVFHCSGGEQQRIAFARLLIKPCDIVLCDEPTGSLDHKNKDIMIELILKLKEMGKTIVIVTHDDDLKDITDKVITLQKVHN